MSALDKATFWFYEKARGASAPRTWLGATLAGFLSLIASEVLGLNNGIRTGYFPAINWWFAYTAFFPIVLLGTLFAIREMDSLIDELSKRKMFLDRQWAVADVSIARAQWKERTRAYGRWAVVLSLVAIAWCLQEWWTNSAGPLWLGHLDAATEVDWSVATLVQKRGVLPRIENGIFSFVAIVGLQGTLAVTALGLLCFLAALGDFVLSQVISANAGAATESTRLVPSITDLHDRRLGFQAFESVLLAALMSVAAVFAMAYASIVWNLFLRTKEQSFLTFVGCDMALGALGDTVGDWLKDVLAAGAACSLVDAPSGPSDASKPVAIAGVCVMVAAVILLIPVILRMAAMRSRDAAIAFIDGEDAKAHPWLNGQDYALVRARFSEMDFWPMKYVSLTQLAVMTSFGALCLAWYRIGLIYLGILTMVIVTKVVRSTRREPPKTDSAAPTQAKDAPVDPTVG
jgi:hypothetical protein